ncbi:MAG: type I DNA topoisomerase [Pseudomonadota bacterium]
MGKSLLIVESPAKARTLKNYLGPDFDVMASMGHVKDLPRSRLGVVPEEGFRPEYHVIKGRQKVLDELCKSARKADNVYLAPDPDREGEAIAWHIAEEIDGKGKEVYRVLLREITQQAVHEAVANPGRLDRERFEAQQARRILDRLVGYQISPLLWEKVKRGLSAGRVQSVAVRILCERERAIQAFVPASYWTISALLAHGDGSSFSARLLERGGKKLDIAGEEECGRILTELKRQSYRVEAVNKKDRRRSALPPFTTSSLQQEAARRLRFSPRRTMAIAQQLYEGIDVQGKATGLITYMRTDSVRVADSAAQEGREYITEAFGKEYVPSRRNVYRNKKGAQDAHEAVRPTSTVRHPDQLKGFLESAQLALYELIWRRFVASQMAPALMEQTVIDIAAGDYLFRLTGSRVKFPGYMVAYVESREDAEEAKQQLPAVAAGDGLGLAELVPEFHCTEPLARFSEATLVKELEEKGIGRPSTYAAILSNIQERGYVMRDKGVLQPTELGLVVNDLLVENFPELLDISFTAHMEDLLDRIEEGDANWVKTLEDFYGPFQEHLERARQAMREVKRSGVATDISCEACGKPMAIKWGKSGEFLACSGYPECTCTRDFHRDEKGVIKLVERTVTKETCDKCGREMTVKRSRFGEFLACSGYPECRNTKPVSDGAVESAAVQENCEKCGASLVTKRSRFGGRFLACSNYPKCKNTRAIKTGASCPRDGCGGDLVEKTSKKGRVFYACSNFPRCRFATWDRPLPQSCPECGAPFLVDKNGTPTCPNVECGYREAKKSAK